VEKKGAHLKMKERNGGPLIQWGGAEKEGRCPKENMVLLAQ